MNFLSKLFDERFLSHRQRSTSLAGQFTVAAALLMFLYRHYVDHVWSWDLLAIGGAFVALKLGLMLWYLFTD